MQWKSSPHGKLPNYLKMYRKRVGLTQKEVAYLFGFTCGSKVSRYETQRRLPALGAALMLEAIFRTPVRELFAGAFEQVQRSVGKRARRLLRQVGRAGRSQELSCKIATLSALARGTTAAITCLPVDEDPSSSRH